MQQRGSGTVGGAALEKLALARALYKDAPVVILDEPAAALDPKAEAEIYARFNEMVEGRTSTYISHRMSNCRFCDDIIVFDAGIKALQAGQEERRFCRDMCSRYKVREGPRGADAGHGRNARRNSRNSWTLIKNKYSL